MSKQAVISKTLTCIKISLAAILAIILANAIRLDFSVSAGIVAILSVQPTKKETVKTATVRFLAFISAMIISFLCYRFLGFTYTAFFVYLVAFIILCQVFGWYSAMAPDSVLISHFLTLQAFGLGEIRNECLLFIIGVGFGGFSNIFLHKEVDVIERLKTESDNLIKQVLFRMSERILNVQLADYDGSCFTTLEKSLYTAKKQAERNFNNQFGKKDTYDTEYIQMREQQTRILRQMFGTLKNITTVPFTAEIIAEFFAKVSVQYHRDNDVQDLLRELDDIRTEMKKQQLPVERGEFEDRAYLFMLLNQLHDFLAIKNTFALSHTAQQGASGGL